MKTNPTLFDTLNNLPNPEHYPTNVGNLDSKTGHLLRSDFDASTDFTIITGFSSLEFLVSFFSKPNLENKHNIRVVLGNEPIYRELRREMPFTSLPQEITDYWLHQNIAANFCWPVLNLIEQIQQGRVEFRLLDGLHAKIYVGEDSAMLGSSNFSQSGLYLQSEANIRAKRTETPSDFEAFRAIAHYYYDKAQNANDFILDLLQKLIQLVTWREALARAIGELLEGDIIRHDPRVAELFHNLTPSLWKVQEEAIGQALYILDNFGSVLIADPTGSGKTKLGAALHICLKNRVLLTGGLPADDNSLLVSPPQVLDNWADEFLHFRSEFNNMISQGSLSYGNDEGEQRLFRKIQNARVIFLDEAHNYLSKTSKRSERLQFNAADHLVLLTATPINRKFEDLFRLIEIMDIDNLDDEAIEQYERLYKLARKGERLSPSDKKYLQSYISQFLIRRTKRELNRRVNQNIEAHRLPNGRVCRYPEQLPATYSLDESQEDIAIAGKINQLANQLKGLIRLRKILLKAEDRQSPEIQTRHLNQRINAAKALSVYFIQATLRSSNAALIEHIEGTLAARKYVQALGYSLKNLKEDKNTGNMIQKLRDYQFSLPRHNLDIQLPPWLSDPTEYQKACQAEMTIYQEIAAQARKLSINREQKKARFLSTLLDKHSLILSFDRNIISLNLLERILKNEYPSSNVLLVTGKEKVNQRTAKKRFGLGSLEKRWIGLCSEVMSEGVNLQQASAVVLLDVPGVMRIAEQRIGRIDRMNSPHDTVEVYFPDDHPEFALRTDRKFFLTAQIVDDMIGGNVDLPEDMLDKWEVEVISGREIAEQYRMEHEKAAQSFEDGIQDAFQAVKDLVFSDQAILDPAIYDEIRQSKSTLTSLVHTSGASFVSSHSNWGFFCLRATAHHSPSWLFVDEASMSDPTPQKRVLKDLPQICERLRTHLQGVTDIREPAEIAKTQQIAERFFSALRDYEIESLPNKKRRAIHLLIDIIQYYLQKEKNNLERRELLRQLQKVLQPIDKAGPVVNYYLLAKKWIRLIQPYLLEAKKKVSRRHVIIHLGSMLKIFKKEPLPTAIFEKLSQGLSRIDPVEKRIAAYIIGVKKVD
ncbi:MAG: hypothetical protein KDD14_17060 [Saprospiraceae bacterium]|nr:hypothetical protein [Saprospiraceae bacterium]